LTNTSVFELDECDNSLNYLGGEGCGSYTYATNGSGTCPASNIQIDICIECIYDLAIEKEVTSTGPYSPGSTVTYEVIIENQGDQDALNVVFTDVPQTGLTYVSSDASTNANITEAAGLVYTVASLPSGESDTLNLTFTIDATLNYL